MNAYEQPDQPQFNRYEFLSSKEEQGENHDYGMFCECPECTEQGEAETLEAVGENVDNETSDKQGEIAEARRINAARQKSRNKWIEEIAIALHTEKCKPRKPTPQT